MRSIQSKFATLCLVGMLLCTVIVGGLGVWSTSRTQEDSSDQILALTCLQEANKLNQELLSIQSSVNGCADVILDDLKSLSLLKDERWLEGYIMRSEQFVGNLARNIPGVCTYYLRFEPELSNPSAGFFYTREGRDGELTSEPLTDILAYSPDDIEHVGWYYQPRNYGHPMWMEPYYNKNIRVYMVSYVVPMYRDDTFVGVVGMDIDFDVITDIVRNIKPYETGCASLVSKEGVNHFHPDYPAGSTITENSPELQCVLDSLTTLGYDELGQITTYVEKGISKKLAYCGLLNDMVLMLSADTAEINAPVSSLFRTVILAGLALALLVLLVVIIISRHITRPLVQLSDVAHEIAEGNLDVEVPQAGNDEVGVLARALDVAVGSLKTYVSGVSAKAYRDALTKVKNKAAYDEAATRLDQEIAKGNANIGLLMADLNNLKQMNDRYGHDHGDDYLKTNCRLICQVFEHSPVFRIGGDEFVVILENHDFEHRDELLVEFDERMEASQTAENPWDRISLARGLATSAPSDSSLDDLFRRADTAMYEDKRRIKDALSRRI